MELIALSVDQLFVGMSLRYTLRDEAGQIMLFKGHKIESAQQLDGIKNRKRIFIEIDHADEGVRAMMAGISALNMAGAPIKDFSKYISVKSTAAPEEKQAGTLVQRWSDVESKLGGLLASVATTDDFEGRIGLLERQIAKLLEQDAAGSQFILFNRAVSHYGGYSVMHSLLCAALASLLAETFALSAQQRRSVVCAALTMNVAMTQMQDTLALQKNAPSPNQRAVIDAHPAVGKRVLERAGVADQDWLHVVAQHHAVVSGEGALAAWPPVARLTRILQSVDRYTAAMSPRKSRSGRTARDSVRTVLIQAGATKHDEVGTALVRVLGLCPPGTFVQLANNETAVVLRSGAKPAEPWVAVVLNARDEPIAEPRLRDTSKAGFAVQSTLTATSVRVNLNTELILRLMPNIAAHPLM